MIDLMCYQRGSGGGDEPEPFHIALRMDCGIKIETLFTETILPAVARALGIKPRNLADCALTSPSKYEPLPETGFVGGSYEQRNTDGGAAPGTKPWAAFAATASQGLKQQARGNRTGRETGLVPGDELIVVHADGGVHLYRCSPGNQQHLWVTGDPRRRGFGAGCTMKEVAPFHDKLDLTFGVRCDKEAAAAAAAAEKRAAEDAARNAAWQKQHEARQAKWKTEAEERKRKQAEKRKVVEAKWAAEQQARQLPGQLSFLVRETYNTAGKVISEAEHRGVDVTAATTVKELKELVGATDEELIVRLYPAGGLPKEYSDVQYGGWGERECREFIGSCQGFLLCGSTIPAGFSLACRK